jgi:hypothetical protein
MVSDTTHAVLTVVIEILSIAGSILAVGAWIGKKFDKVQDKFDRLCADIHEIHLEAGQHVTFQHCHDKREACPCVSAIKEIKQNLQKSTTRSRRKPRNEKN